MTPTENRKAKARAIGPYLARTGLTRADIARLPHASRDRSAPTQRAFARAAYAAAYREAAANGWTEYPRDLSEPSHPGSETWRLAEHLREWIAANPGADMPTNPWYLRAPTVDLPGEHAKWILPADAATEDDRIVPEEDPCQSRTPQCPAPGAGTTPTSMTSTDDAWSPPGSPARSEIPGGQSGNQRSARAGGDWPRHEGASCPCGIWTRRYGPRGAGALCLVCRAVALGAAS